MKKRINELSIDDLKKIEELSSDISSSLFGEPCDVTTQNSTHEPNKVMHV